MAASLAVPVVFGQKATDLPAWRHTPRQSGRFTSPRADVQQCSPTRWQAALGVLAGSGDEADKGVFGGDHEWRDVLVISAAVTILVIWPDLLCQPTAKAAAAATNKFVPASVPDHAMQANRRAPP